MEIDIPEFALVRLVGPSGCGKSTFAARHFRRTQVLSSDACRALVSDDENNQVATRDAFDVLHFIAEKRLASGYLTLIDATNIQPSSRKLLRALAHQHHMPLVAIIFDHGKLVVAHAGIKKGMIGRESDRIREFTLYGETTGEVDAYGLPVRANWTAQYRGQAIIVYGHTAVPRPEWLNKTIDIDTGCVYGGSLTALRYPELDLVSVQAKYTYRQAPRPAMQA